MDWLSLILLASALAMDAFSAAVTDGMIVKNINIYDTLRVGFFFGFFQFLMPCIGNFLSGFADGYIESVDHWIAFCLLVFLGMRMIVESREIQEIPKDPLKTSSLLFMAVATSIDALAAGVTLAAMDAPVFLSSLVVGITAFVLSVCGIFIGRKSGDILGSKAEIGGGIILIIIGFKTLIEHLS